MPMIRSGNPGCRRHSGRELHAGLIDLRVPLPDFVFDRLYVLRNQLVHGGSTCNSGVNRALVRDGAAIPAFLMPVFVDLILENPHEDWGRPSYPVVE